MVPMFLWVWSLVATPAQTVAFTDDFACSNDATFGLPAGDNGWQAIYTTDPWSTALNGGVSPLTDTATGSFGGAINDYENFLVTGDLL